MQPIHSRWWVKLTIVAISLPLTLSGCLSTHKSDGPPRYSVDVSRIPNATPKPERHSKYGNMKSYKVFGKRYYPLRSSSNFTQTGIASWYGSKFHNRRTSSGEKYDMLGMTAAHKRLPLPTYVEVTNLRNHRKIIVKVNDRGPFASNRVIDLSYVAAKKLGMLGKGTAKVRIRAINPYTWAKNKGSSAAKRYRSNKAYAHRYPKKYRVAAKPSKKHLARAKSHAVYLQAGAFRGKSYADRLKKRLSSMISYPIMVQFPKENSHLYRVRIGPINDTASEQSITQKLNEIGISPNKVHGA